MPTIREFTSALRSRPGVNAVLISGSDGLLIEGTADESLDQDDLAARIPTFISEANAIGAAAASGACATCITEYESGYAIVSAIAPETFMTVLAAKTADLGGLLFAVRSQHSKMRELVQLPEQQTWHVIMADDEPHIGRIVQMKLEQGPFVVTLTYDGEEAVQTVLSADRVDLLLLDLMMPRKSGLEVLRTLREEDRFKSLPIVILTAGGNPQDQRAALELGATEVLTKPFSPKKLYSLVERLTVGGESGAPAE